MAEYYFMVFHININNYISKQLMPSLNEVIGSDDSLHQHRGLLILQQVVKALASKRLRNDRRIFKVFI